MGVAAAAALAASAAQGDQLQPTLAAAYRGDPVIDVVAKYSIFNALDGDPKTTWVANGQTALFEYDPATLTAIELIAGYSKSAKLWRANRRPVRLRYRLWAEAADGGVEAGAWQTAGVESAAKLPGSDALYSTIGIKSAGASRAIEIQVIAGTKRTKYDDICVSEIRLRGAIAAEPLSKNCERVVSKWVFVEMSRTSNADLQDRLAAHFDAISFAECSYRHDGTGGGTMRFSGTCEPGKARKGERRYRFVGAEQVGAMHPGERPKNVTREIRFKPIGERLAVIDGYLYSARMTKACR